MTGVRLDPATWGQPVMFNSVWMWRILEDSLPYHHHHHLPDSAIQCLHRQNYFLKPLSTATLIHFISHKPHFSATAQRIQIRTGACQGSQEMASELHLVSFFFPLMLPQHTVERSWEFAKWQQSVCFGLCLLYRCFKRSVNIHFSGETIKTPQIKFSHTLKHTKKHGTNLPSDVPLLFFFLVYIEF